MFQALLLLSKFSPDIAGDQMETCRLHDAVNVLLSLQAWNSLLCILYAIRQVQDIEAILFHLRVVNQKSKQFYILLSPQQYPFFKRPHPSPRFLLNENKTALAAVNYH